MNQITKEKKLDNIYIPVDPKKFKWKKRITNALNFIFGIKFVLVGTVAKKDTKDIKNTSTKNEA